MPAPLVPTLPAALGSAPDVTTADGAQAREGSSVAPPRERSATDELDALDALEPRGAFEGSDALDEGAEVAAAPRPFKWKVNLALFLVTVASVLYAGLGWADFDVPEDALGQLAVLHRGWPFALPLLAILVTHEFGHYFAALIHGVPASLPYFIPIPKFSPFGTMGAVIGMPDRIRSRAALLDIGAAGPLAGLVVALPVLAYGLATSPVMPLSAAGIQEGQSLLYLAMKRVFVGVIPDGHDVFLNATAMAGWTGLLVTTINLLPVAQLDGGHIAYALFGEKQNKYSRLVHHGLLAVVAFNLVKFGAPMVASGDFGEWDKAVMNSASWLTWYGLLHVIRRLGEGKGDHPPTEPGPLGPVRKGVAIFSLVLFVLLFMPTPWALL